MLRDDEILPPEDLQRLHHLKARYFRSVDTKDWIALREVFADDIVVYDHVDEPTDRDIRYRDADSFVEFIRTGMLGKISVHHGHMPELRRIDDDTASGIWSMEDLVQDQATGKGIRGLGHYHERYIRTGGGWKIKELRLTRLRVDHLPGADPIG
jgi:SnoaL-like domain